MEITKRSKVKEIQKIPDILEVLKKHTGQDVAPALLKMAGPLSLESAAKQMGWSGEQVDAIIQEINQINS